MLPAWGVGLAVLSLLSFKTQQGYLLSSMLTGHGWEPISRLSFSMYLLHPLVINVWVLSQTSKFRYSHLNFLVAFTGIVGIIIFVAALVEWPVSKITRNMEKRLWNKRS